MFGSMRKTIEDEVRHNVLVQWSTRSAGKKQASSCWPDSKPLLQGGCCGTLWVVWET